MLSHAERAHSRARSACATTFFCLRLANFSDTRTPATKCFDVLSLVFLFFFFFHLGKRGETARPPPQKRSKKYHRQQQRRRPSTTTQRTHDSDNLHSGEQNRADANKNGERRGARSEADEEEKRKQKKKGTRRISAGDDACDAFGGAASIAQKERPRNRASACACVCGRKRQHRRPVPRERKKIEKNKHDACLQLRRRRRNGCRRWPPGRMQQALTSGRARTRYRRS